jgi:DNA-binding transcriptional MerR regulator
MSKPAGADREGAVSLPSIPAKRYFTIGEVSDLCAVKPHVLRYWEQEFTQLKPIKRRGNRRYYQHHEVLLIRRIRDLLYEQGFTINGARNKLDGASIGNAARGRAGRGAVPNAAADLAGGAGSGNTGGLNLADDPDGVRAVEGGSGAALAALHEELLAIRALLVPLPAGVTDVEN